MNDKENYLGTRVKIQRSDNRIHDAVISKVVPETKAFLVEWFENGDRWLSKEVSFDVMRDLNPDLNLHASSPLSENLLTANRPASGSKPQEKPAAAAPRGKIARYSTSTALYGPGPSASNGTAAGVGAGAADAVMMPPPMAMPAPMAMPPPMPDSRRTAAAAQPSKGSLAPKVRKTVVKDSIDALQKNRESRRSVAAKKMEQKNLEPPNPNQEFLNMIREFRSNLQCQPLKDGDALEDHQITVCVRKRPMNKKEIEKKDIDVLTIPSKNTLIVHEPKAKVDLTKYLDNQTFVFDYAFDVDSTNELVYKYTAKPLVQTIFDGGMATCFAYGQTGSGKTHTMGGTFVGKNQDSSKGIYAFVAADVFKALKPSGLEGLGLGLTVNCSFFEIYNGKVFDLLNGKAKLRVLEDGQGKVQVVNLTEKNVQNVADVLKLISAGNSVRTSGKTAVNEMSSRSHAVFQIVLRTKTKKLHGKFSLIDLAGNERGKDSNSSNRSTRVEGSEINKSLLALKECIRALGMEKKMHLPFRASVLTKVLRDSFIGKNSKTCMIAMISPGFSSCENTINTLRYADRVKELGAPGASASDDNDLGVIDEDGDFEEDDDLAQLQSFNEHEMTPEILKHHSAVSHIQRLEEEVLDDHRAVAETQDNWSAHFEALLKMTEEPGYDVDAYVQQLEEFLGEKIEMYNNLLRKTGRLRKLLSEEELVACSIKKK